MKIALQMMSVNPKFWVATSQEAEAAGFESIWLPEHLVFPVEMSGSPYTGHPEPPIDLHRAPVAALHLGQRARRRVAVDQHAANAALAQVEGQCQPDRPRPNDEDLCVYGSPPASST